MKTFRIFLLISLAILILAACAQSPAATAAPAATASSASVPAATEPAAATTKTKAEMETLITEKAHDKHTLDFILSHKMTAEQWSVTLDRMIGYGAKINTQEKDLIIKFLVALNK